MIPVRCLIPAFFVLLVLHSHALAENEWQRLAPGLEFREFAFAERAGVQERTLSVLRIDPGSVSLVLGSALEKDRTVRTVPEWAGELDCAAVINASMYRADSPLRSTGYMRNFDRVNNGFIHPEYGAFLVFNPRGEGSAPARIVDRTQPGWRERLAEYNTVIQNFRLIDPQGNNLWPEGGEEHSIAAVATTIQGRVLFLHCAAPVTLHSFNEHLLSLPLGVDRAMYVEGGSDAGLFINTPAREIRRPGRYRSGVWAGPAPAFPPVPNVIGIRFKF